MTAVVDAINNTMTGLPEGDRADILTQSLKQMRMLERTQRRSIPTKAGRKQTPFDTRKLGGKHWHNMSSHSTLTSRPAKLKVTNKPKLHQNFDYDDTVNIVRQRNIFYYECNWRILQKTTHML